MTAIHEGADGELHTFIVIIRPDGHVEERQLEEEPCCE